jgi:hypothetical protein
MCATQTTRLEDRSNQLCLMTEETNRNHEVLERWKRGVELVDPFLQLARACLRELLKKWR